MKITFTREEVEEVLLAHVRRNFTQDLNTVELRNIYSAEYAVVTYEPPAEAAPLTGPAQEAA